MSLRISFELDDDDLKHFRLIMRQARNAAARIAPEDIVAACEDLLRTATVRDRTPGFIVERLDKLRLMIDMLSDIEWRLPQDEATRVLNALAYFAEPEDLIPDDIPGLGFLDDAIMIELVMRELSHEIEAYQDFCDYRKDAHTGRASRGVSREQWLDDRRGKLQSRMRRRRKRSEQNDDGHGGLGLFG